MKFYRVQYKPYIKLRIYATLIDYGIYFVFFYVYLTFAGKESENGVYHVEGLAALPIFGFWLFYFVLLEFLNQTTPGHDIVKLKIFKEDGTKPRISDILKRRILDPIDIFFYGIPAIICISKTPRHQRIGDLWANTVVAKSVDIIETEYLFN